MKTEKKTKSIKEEYIEPDGDPLAFQVINNHINNVDKLSKQEKELFLDIIAMWCYPSVKMNANKIDFSELINNRLE